MVEPTDDFCRNPPMERMLRPEVQPARDALARQGRRLWGPRRDTIERQPKPEPRRVNEFRGRSMQILWHQQRQPERAQQALDRSGPIGMSCIDFDKFAGERHRFRCAADRLGDTSAKYQELTRDVDPMSLDALELFETVCTKRERKLLFVPSLRTKFFGLRCSLCLYLLPCSPARTCGSKGGGVEQRRPRVEELRGRFDVASSLLRSSPRFFGVLQFVVNLLEPGAHVRRGNGRHDVIAFAAPLLDAARDLRKSYLVRR